MKKSSIIIINSPDSLLKLIQNSEGFIKLFNREDNSGEENLPDGIFAFEDGINECRTTSEALADFPEVPAVIFNASPEFRLSKDYGNRIYMVPAEPGLRSATGLIRIITDFSESLKEKKIYERQYLDLNSRFRDYNRRISKEIQLIREIQFSLSGGIIPGTNNLDTSSIYLPADSTGGELFFMDSPDTDTLLAAMLSVFGKGVPSAMIAAMARISFMNHIRIGLPLNKVLELINNELIYQIPVEYSISLFTLKVDMKKGALEYAQAGNVSAFIHRKSTREIADLRGKSLELCLTSDPMIHSGESSFLPGDKLLLFSDGLRENKNEKLESYGLDRVLDSFRRHAFRSAGDLTAHMSTDYNTHIKKSAPEYDVSLACVEHTSEDSLNMKFKRDLGFDPDENASIYTLRIYNEIEQIINSIMREALLSGVSEKAVYRAKVVLAEILSNAVEHGNKEDMSKRALAGYLLKKGKFIFACMDEGEGFDYNNLPDPTQEENIARIGKRGLYIIKNYCDEVQFNENGNLIRVSLPTDE
ncbi:MAG: SpoIIE family protein phosphatase [Fibrobacterota bacterium]